MYWVRIIYHIYQINHREWGQRGIQIILSSKPTQAECRANFSNRPRGVCDHDKSRLEALPEISGSKFAVNRGVKQ